MTNSSHSENIDIRQELELLGLNYETSSRVIAILEKGNVKITEYSKLIEVPLTQEERLGFTKRLSYKSWKKNPKNKHKSPLDCLLEVWGSEINDKKINQKDLTQLDRPLVMALRSYFSSIGKYESLNKYIPTISEFYKRFRGKPEDYMCASTIYRSIIRN